MKKQATSIYLLKEDKILFLVRNKENDTVHQQGKYLPIGGKVELGESIESSAIREVKEEAGIIVNTLELKGIYYARGLGTGENDWVCFLFTSSNFEGEPVAGSEGHFAWVDGDKIQDVNLYPGDKIYLEYLFKYQFFVVEFHYNGFELIDYKLIKAI